MKESETEDGGLTLKSRRTQGFEDFKRLLPVQIQKEIKGAFDLFIGEASYSLLQFRQISQDDPLYSIRIDQNHRAVGWLEDSEPFQVIHWFWVGSYEDYGSSSQLPIQRGNTSEERLSLAIHAASALPDDFQATLAEEILTEMSEQEWDALFSSPEGQRWLEKSADEAAAEYQAGKTLEGGFGEDEELSHKTIMATL